MPNCSIGRCLERAFFNLRDQLFLAVAILTLVIIALAFSFNQEHQAYSTYCQTQKHASEEGCYLDKAPFIPRLLDDPTALFTSVLALLTLILAGVGVAQIVFLKRADETARKSADAALITARVAQQSVDLAREEFLASHRPDFVIHSVYLLPFDHSPPPSEQMLKARFVVINRGESAGILISSGVYLECAFKEDTPWRNQPSRNEILTHTIYQVGNADTVTVSGDAWSGLNFIGRDESGKEVYLFGWLLYEDERHKGRRTTYFCRRYDDVSGCFVVINDDPDANQTY